MKNILFLLVAFIALFSQNAQAQAAPANEEAKQLVQTSRKNKAAIDSLLQVFSNGRAAAQRANNTAEVQFCDKAIKLLRDTKSFDDQVIAAGEGMSAAKLEGFKTTAGRLDQQATSLLSSPPNPAAGQTLQQCLQNCSSYYYKWWMIVARIGCKLACYF